MYLIIFYRKIVGNISKIYKKVKSLKLRLEITNANLEIVNFAFSV